MSKTTVELKEISRKETVRTDIIVRVLRRIE